MTMKIRPADKIPPGEPGRKRSNLLYVDFNVDEFGNSHFYLLVVHSKRQSVEDIIGKIKNKLEMAKINQEEDGTFEGHYKGKSLYYKLVKINTFNRRLEFNWLCDKFGYNGNWKLDSNFSKIDNKDGLSQLEVYVDNEIIQKEYLYYLKDLGIADQ